MVIDLDFWGGLEIFRDFAPPLEIVEIFEKVEMLTPENFSGSYTLQSPNVDIFCQNIPTWLAYRPK